MKRIVMVLALIFVTHSTCFLTFGFSQESNDNSEIKKIINEYIDSFVFRDVSLVKKDLSHKFSSTIGGQTVDYEHFESFRNEQSEKFYKNHIDCSQNKLDISKLEVSDNQAFAEATFIWQAFNLDTLEDDIGKEELKFLFVKENDAWKIVSVVDQPALKEDSPTLFKKDPDLPEIRKTVDSYLQYFARKDVNSMMSLISLKYKDTVDGKVMDYDAEKKFFEFIFNVRLKKFINWSISDIRYVYFTNKDGVARVRANYIWKGDNTETGKREEYNRGRDFELTKENGTWMIIRLSRE
jgi:hypothetical protein